MRGSPATEHRSTPNAAAGLPALLRAYLRHLFAARELLVYRLLSLHNLTFYLGLLADMRAAILEGRFDGIPRSVSRAIWGSG